MVVLVCTVTLSVVHTVFHQPSTLVSSMLNPFDPQNNRMGAMYTRQAFQGLYLATVLMIRFHWAAGLLSTLSLQILGR